ncbi:MAG: adenylyltransferase/cytidyltransferase family protein [Nanohaloarchaea archaeon]|nr:adenylyltransferase/cytidyltransferase family protein [Candidatus Nanohaloarchaea archaeon]
MTKVFLGRFQPLHLGHKNVIENQDDLVVAVGSSGKSGEEENPLSFEQRKRLIKDCFPDVEVVGVEDTEDDVEWLRNLLEKTGADTILSRNSNVRAIVENSDRDVKVVKQELYDEEIYSGTEVRRRIRSGEEWRYLTPPCCKESLEEFLEDIKDSGIQHEFEPGWKRENASYDTAEK